MREAKNRNCESKSIAAAVLILRSLSLRGGENPPSPKGSNAFSDPHPSSERRKSPMRKKGGKGFTPPATHNFACSLLSSPPKQRKKFGTRSFELVVARRQ
jgi:hypothetical protein